MSPIVKALVEILRKNQPPLPDQREAGILYPNASPNPRDARSGGKPPPGVKPPSAGDGV
jgi:hypothetical protein